LDFAPHEPRNALLFPPAYEGAPSKPVVKAIQRANTRFRPEEPRARSNTTRSYPDLSSVSSETTSAAADEGLVPMTPRILPGGDQSPLMTWGAVGTPRLLESDDRRQELGRALDARAKRRRTAPPAPSPLRAALDARRASRRPSSSRPSRSSARTPGRSPRPPPGR